MAAMDNNQGVVEALNAHVYKRTLASQGDYRLDLVINFHVIDDSSAMMWGAETDRVVETTGSFLLVKTENGKEIRTQKYRAQTNWDSDEDMFIRHTMCDVDEEPSVEIANHNEVADEIHMMLGSTIDFDDMLTELVRIESW